MAPVDVHGAVKLVDYFKSHLARIGHQMTAGIGNADAKALADWIKRHRLTMFRESEVREHLRRFRDKPADLAAAINALKALGAIRPRPEPPEPGKRGPKFSPAYDVHPDLLGSPDNSADSANSPSEPPPEAISGIGGIIGRVQGDENPAPRPGGIRAMTLPELVEALEAGGVKLSLRLVVDSPRGGMTDQIKTALAAHKPALLARLGRDAQWEQLAAQRLGTGPDVRNRPITRTDRFRPRR